MARSTGIDVIVAALVQLWRGTPDVTALVPSARIVSDVQAGLEMPYVLVEHVTETDDDTLSRGGVDAVISATVVSRYHGPKEAGRIASALRDAADGAAVVVAGFDDPADVTYEQALGGYTDDDQNTRVRYKPVWFRVRAL